MSGVSRFSRLFLFKRSTMENLSENEFKEFLDMESVKEMISILDKVLDGETYHVHITDTDVTVNKNLKPVLPKGLTKSKNAQMLKNKNLYAIMIQILIALLIDLNPQNTEDDDDYAFRIAIITNTIAMGTVCKNQNWIEGDVEFNKDFVKNRGKSLLEDKKIMVSKVQNLMNAAHNFLAFSTMNMVRFNHHFPIEKVNLISKSLLALPVEQRNRLLEEDNFYTFYNSFVTAARISNDKLYYEKFMLRKENDDNEYFYYPLMGIYNPNYEEEIINIRKECTPNSFLILDIVNEIVKDIQSRKLLFLVPYQQQLATLLNIRNHIRKNPFSYHPAKIFYNCKAQDFDKVVGMFNTIMNEIGSFIFEYSDNMYESVRSAKCRNKYQKNIKKDDEILVKNILDISNVDVAVDEKEKEIIRKKLYINKYEIKEDSNIDEIIKECNDKFKVMIDSNLFN